MKNKEKKRLIRELCIMLSHGVIVSVGDDNKGVLDAVYPRDEAVIVDELTHNITLENGVKVNYGRFSIEEDNVKPFLRPVSTMTDKEMDTLFDILNIPKDGSGNSWIKINDLLGIEFFLPDGEWAEVLARVYDYLNSIHIDYRGFIGVGLALEAPEGMY